MLKLPLGNTRHDSEKIVIYDLLHKQRVKKAEIIMLNKSNNTSTTSSEKQPELPKVVAIMKTEIIQITRMKCKTKEPPKACDTKTC